MRIIFDKSDYYQSRRLTLLDLITWKWLGKLGLHRYINTEFTWLLLLTCESYHCCIKISILINYLSSLFPLIRDTRRPRCPTCSSNMHTHRTRTLVPSRPALKVHTSCSRSSSCVLSWSWAVHLLICMLAFVSPTLLTYPVEAQIYKHPFVLV